MSEICSHPRFIIAMQRKTLTIFWTHYLGSFNSFFYQFLCFHFVIEIMRHYIAVNKLIFLFVKCMLQIENLRIESVIVIGALGSWWSHDIIWLLKSTHTCLLITCQLLGFFLNKNLMLGWDWAHLQLFDSLSIHSWICIALSIILTDIGRTHYLFSCVIRSVYCILMTWSFHLQLRFISLIRPLNWL